MRRAGVAEYIEGFRAVKQQAERLNASLSAVQFNWKPTVVRWSIGQCIEHLNRTAAATLPGLDWLIEECRQANVRAPGPFAHRWRRRLLYWLLEPPYRLRTGTFPDLVPAALLQRSAVMQRFLEANDAFIERAQSVAGYDLRVVEQRIRAKATLPMHIGEWFQFVLTHERRHLWQAEQVRRHPFFPA